MIEIFIILETTYYAINFEVKIIARYALDMHARLYFSLRHRKFRYNVSRQYHSEF